MNGHTFSFSTLKRHEKELAMGLFFLFFILFAWQAFKALVPKHSTQIIEPMKATPKMAQAITNKSDVFKVSLFGEYLPEDLSGAAIKRSTLNLTLEGILYTKRQKDALATIRLSDGQVKTYMVGDELPGGAVIKQIRKDSVVVLYRGKLESLGLPKNELRFEEPAKPLFEE